ncbi:MAG: ABC transporter ATP-binding protein [Corynebacterium sp.]|uniref:ABC transporter ATP-binding protein n=1 Tax=Corynebacterium sp. TaxID=1720 RepID=UPI0026DCD873|nr:ABC transporter ATP-binding protein [Corynebacterium sp.]MDO5030521.1 ABC transporter ATP-binding protein [Corynebacterium sp.]
MSNSLNCRNVSFRYLGADSPSLSDVSLTASAGEWLSIIGPNGCGKSTLLHCIAGLNRFTGDIEVAGGNPRRIARRQLAQKVALMPQQPVIPEGLRIRDYIALGRTPYRGREGGVVDAVMERLNLTAYAQRTLNDVSGGELQRVVLARSLAQEPEVLLLDEPTSALDIGMAQQVMEIIDEIRLESGLTVIAAVHDLTLAGQYSDRIALLSGGKLVRAGSPSEVLTEDTIACVYGASVRVMSLDTKISAPVVIPQRPS